MLLGDFFSIKKIDRPSVDAVTATLQLYPHHAIYEGHFPQMPLVPGVCMIEMVREVLCKVLGRELRLVEAGNIKFTAMVDPRQHDVLELDLQMKELREEKAIQLRGRMGYGETVCLKLTGKFR